MSENPPIVWSEGYSQFSTLKNKILVNGMNHFLFYKERWCFYCIYCEWLWFSIPNPIILGIMQTLQSPFILQFIPLHYSLVMGHSFFMSLTYRYGRTVTALLLSLLKWIVIIGLLWGQLLLCKHSVILRITAVKKIAGKYKRVIEYFVNSFNLVFW